jgi:hypothetical protein
MSAIRLDPPTRRSGDHMLVEDGEEPTETDADRAAGSVRADEPASAPGDEVEVLQRCATFDPRGR